MGTGALRRQIPYATASVPVKKSDGKLRLCGTYNQTINPGIDSDTYQTDTTHTVFVKLGNGNKVFAEVDLEAAHTQCPVDEPTSMLLTLNTPRGLSRVTTLPYGVKCASAAFQRIGDAVVGGIDGVVAYQDNVFVAAQDSASLHQRLHRVLLALSEAGLRVNREKCTWGKSVARGGATGARPPSGFRLRTGNVSGAAAEINNICA